MCRTAHAILSVAICGIQMLVRVFMTFILMLENVFRLLLQTFYNLLAFVLQMLSLIPICLVFLATTRLKCFMCGGGGPCPVNRGGGCDCLMSFAAVLLLFFIFRAVGVLDKIFYKIGYVQVPPSPEGPDGPGSRHQYYQITPAPGDVTECSRDATEGDATECAKLTTTPANLLTSMVPFGESSSYETGTTGPSADENIFRFGNFAPITTETFDTEMITMTETQTETDAPKVSETVTYESDQKKYISVTVQIEKGSTSISEIEGIRAYQGVDESFSSPIPAPSSAVTFGNVNTHTEIYFKDPDVAMKTDTFEFVPIKARREIKPNILITKITKAMKLDTSLAETVSVTEKPQIKTGGTANPQLEIKSEKPTRVLIDALDYFNKQVTTAMHYVA